MLLIVYDKGLYSLKTYIIIVKNDDDYFTYFTCCGLGKLYMALKPTKTVSASSSSIAKNVLLSINPSTLIRLLLPAEEKFLHNMIMPPKKCHYEHSFFVLRAKGLILLHIWPIFAIEVPGNFTKPPRYAHVTISSGWPKKTNFQTI